MGNHQHQKYSDVQNIMISNALFESITGLIVYMFYPTSSAKKMVHLIHYVLGFDYVMFSQSKQGNNDILYKQNLNLNYSPMWFINNCVLCNRTIKINQTFQNIIIFNDFFPIRLCLANGVSFFEAFGKRVGGFSHV